MSDSVTPPRPTAPTAAELRDRFVRKLEVHLASLSAAADAREDLDRLVAAVRAEALASERERCALELDELAQEADMAALRVSWWRDCGHRARGSARRFAAATACAYRDGAARIRALVSK